MKGFMEDEEYARRFGQYNNGKGERPDGEKPHHPWPLSKPGKAVSATERHVKDVDSAHGRHMNDAAAVLLELDEIKVSLHLLAEQVHIAEEHMRSVVGATPGSDNAITATEAVLMIKSPIPAMQRQVRRAIDAIAAYRGLL